MLKWAIKKYIVGKVNGLIAQHKENIDKVRDTLEVWTSRLEKVISCFRSISAKLDDGLIDSDEIDQIGGDVEDVVKSW